MGIKGLKTFIDKNPQFLADYKLRDIRVVVDGNSFYFFLYYFFNIPCNYGGDYDVFCKQIRQVFSHFKTCNISPYLVFDGGHEPSGRKFTTVLARACQRRRLAGNISCGGEGKIVPILAYEAFHKVVKEMNIPHASCVNEADDQIAALANDWNCPVLSNDSDFYVFDLKGGFIPLDYINFNRCSEEDSDHYLCVKIYHTDNFAKCFKGLGKTVLPLLATVLGNDYVDRKTFKAFYKMIKYTKYETHSSDQFVLPKNHKRLTSVMHWINCLSSIESGLEQVLKLTPDPKRKALKDIILQSMESYTNIHTYKSFNLLKFFTEGDAKESAEMGELCDYYGNPLPAWFTTALRTCQIPTLMQNVAVLHRVILYCQVEQMTETSAFRCSAKVRQIVYGLVISSTDSRMASTSESKCSRDKSVEEYDREIKNPYTFYMEPIKEIPCCGDKHSLEEIPKLSQRHRQDIIFSGLGIPRDIFSDNIMSLNLVFFAIWIWMQNSVPKISLNHLKAYIVNLIMLHLKYWRVGSEQVSEPREMLDSQFHLVFRELSEKDLNQLWENLDKFCKKNPNRTYKKNPIDPDVIHGYSQLQVCLCDLIYLNKLLLCPFQTPCLELIFNGTFLYSFCRELHCRTNQDLDFAEMLVKDSPVLKLYNNFVTMVTGELFTSSL